jgi:hypothetical protein
VRVTLLWIAVVAQLGGCRFHFDELSDAAPLGPWGAPRPLTELNLPGSNEYGPWLSEDRLEIVFTSNRNGGNYQLFRALRASASDPFGAPALLPVPGAVTGDDAFITDDGLTLWYANVDPTTSAQSLYVATRASTAEDFGTPQLVDELNMGVDASGPTLSSDELTIVFNSKRNGSEDLFIATRASKTSPWSTPQLLSTVSTPTSHDCCGWLSGDARTLVFASDENAHPMQLFSSNRGSSGFEAYTVFDPILSSGSTGEADPTLTRDQRTIVFASLRGGTFYDLYIADR